MRKSWKQINLALGLTALSLSPALAGGPANDDCVNATVVSDGSFSGTTVGASNDGSDSCGGAASADVWYVYTAPMDGEVVASTCSGSTLNTVVSIWDECPGSGVELECNDNCCILQSTAFTNVVAGEDYYIRVAGWNGSTGAFNLDIETVPVLSGPDVIYSNILNVTNWGVVDGVRAYSMDSYTCNVGDSNLRWGETAPLMSSNAYCLNDGRLIQIGMSWVKNGTTAAATAGCGLPCNGQEGCVLGAGCRDVYTANFNGIQLILGARSTINPLTGAYPGPAPGDFAGEPLLRRLQVTESDLSVPGALYFLEGQYVAPDDAAAGNAMNNTSHKRVSVTGSFDLLPVGDIQVSMPAIFAWRDHGLGLNQPDPDVHIAAVDVPNEGRFHVAWKVSDLGGGMWHYEYAVRNFNSQQAGGGFSVPIPKGANISNVGFNDVDYHSGEPYDNTDWNSSIDRGSVNWSSPQTFADNPNSNALRWGTMYNFWFDADVAPGKGNAAISLFEPGVIGVVDAAVDVPGGGSECLGDLDDDGEVAVTDLVTLITSWGTCPGCPADLTGDGEVEVPDLVEMILNWGPCP